MTGVFVRFRFDDRFDESAVGKRACGPPAV
jgi:hypothetical protein